MKFKKKYSMLLCLFLPVWLFLSCDRDEISVLQSESFLKFYGAGMRDMGMQVISLDEGYLIMGNIEDPDRGQDIIVIRTDRFGNTVQFPIIIGGKFKDEGIAMKANDQGFILVGSTRKQESGYSNAYIVQLNAEATEVLWEIDTGFSMNDEARDVFVHENGDIAVCGSTEIDGEGLNVLLIEVNFTDDTFQLDIRDYGQSEDEIATAISISNGRYVLAGYAGMPAGNTSGISWRPFALKWDWASNIGILGYRTIGDNHNGKIIDIEKVADGNYYLACHVEDVETQESYVQVATLDMNRSPWQWTFPENLQFGEGNRNSVSEMKISGDKLYLAGTSSESSDRGDMFIMDGNLDGSGTEYLYQGDGNSYQAIGFDITAEGGFILTGAVYTSEQSAIVLSKLRN